MVRIGTALLVVRPLLLISLASCGDSAPQNPATVGDGDFVVDISGDARTITLRRRGDALLTFPADAFQVGTVPQLSATLAYDPFAYETDDASRRDWPDG